MGKASCCLLARQSSQTCLQNLRFSNYQVSTLAKCVSWKSLQKSNERAGKTCNHAEALQKVTCLDRDVKGQGEELADKLWHE